MFNKTRKIILSFLLILICTSVMAQKDTSAVRKKEPRKFTFCGTVKDTITWDEYRHSKELLAGINDTTAIKSFSLQYKLNGLTYIIRECDNTNMMSIWGKNLQQVANSKKDNKLFVGNIIGTLNGNEIHYKGFAVYLVK